MLGVQKAGFRIRRETEFKFACLMPLDQFATCPCSRFFQGLRSHGRICETSIGGADLSAVL